MESPSKIEKHKYEKACVDAIKLICAFGVVAIHTEPFGDYYWLDKALGILTRLPVPFFFTASGYFLFLKEKEKTDAKRMCGYCQRIGLLYVLWGLLYMPILIGTLHSASGASSFPWQQFFKALVWTGVSSHLWFLIATIVASMMVWGLYQITTPKWTLLVSLGILFLGTFCSTYRPVSSTIVHSWIMKTIEFFGARSGIFYGFFYVALGGYFTSGQRRNKLRQDLLGWFVGMFLLIVESFVAIKFKLCGGTILWFSCPIAVAFLFLVSLEMRLPIPETTARKIRYVSTIIYVSQFLVITFLKTMGVPAHGIVLFVMTCAITLAFSFVLISLRKTIPISKYLY